MSDPTREVGRTPGGDLVVSAKACAEALPMVTHVIRNALGPAGRAFTVKAERLGLAYRRSESGTNVPVVAEGGSRSLRDPINAAVAARILGCSDRNVRKLAERLHGRNDLGRGWLFERATVLAFARDGGVLTDGSDSGSEREAS